MLPFSTVFSHAQVLPFSIMIYSWKTFSKPMSRGDVRIVAWEHEPAGQSSSSLVGRDC